MGKALHADKRRSKRVWLNGHTLFAFTGEVD